MHRLTVRSQVTVRVFFFSVELVEEVLISFHFLKLSCNAFTFFLILSNQVTHVLLLLQNSL